MKINVIVIDKKVKKGLYQELIEYYVKMAKPFATINIIDLFNNEIAKAQGLSAHAARQSYTKAMENYMKQGRNIALDPSSKEVDSHDFAKLLKNSMQINLFIGGAYGFEGAFLDKCNNSISFGKITLSHKLMKVVLLEQIFRGLAINHNHPYHK